MTRNEPQDLSAPRTWQAGFEWSLLLCDQGGQTGVAGAAPPRAGCKPDTPQVALCSEHRKSLCTLSILFTVDEVCGQICASCGADLGVPRANTRCNQPRSVAPGRVDITVVRRAKGSDR